MKKHNFSAGPSILPEKAIEETINALGNFAGTGISLASISHRSKEFDKVSLDAQQSMKDLLSIPAGYEVLFLGGGASMQFCMVPFNMLNKKAVYLNTGTWADNAAKEARFFGDVVDIKGADYFSIPKNFKVDDDADYFHFTSNNTIFGTEILTDFDLNIPVISDMSSDILSRPIDISKYGIIYGGAQKNLAPAGVTFVIIKSDILGRVERKIPKIMDYRTHIKGQSMFNTPPVIPIFTLNETLKWVKANGGVEGMEKRAIERADMLYTEIDRNRLFRGTVAVEDRSRMNVCFVLKDEYKDLEAGFGDLAKTKGFVGLAGHRSVGGFRASLYNALELESVKALVDAMKEYESKN